MIFKWLNKWWLLIIKSLIIDLKSNLIGSYLFVVGVVDGVGFGVGVGVGDVVVLRGMFE